MGFLFSVFYQPIANAIFFIMGNFGISSLAVAALITIVVMKVVLFPLAVKNTRFQLRVQGISKELKEAQGKYKDSKQRMEKILALYKRAGVNPFTPILFMLVQIPLVLSLFFIFRDLGSGTFLFSEVLYSTLSIPELDFFILSFNLMNQGGIIMALLVGLSQALFIVYLQANISSLNIKTTQKFLLIIVLPLVATSVAFFFNALIGLFWTLSNLIAVLQEILLVNLLKKKSQKSKA